MKPKSKPRFTIPLSCLWLFSLLLISRTHTLLTAPFIGLAAFLLVQLLYNVSWSTRHPDSSNVLERMTSAQLNDPGMGGMAARGGNRYGTFAPTRDIRATDLQRTTVGSWLIVALTLLGTITQAADKIDTLNFHNLWPYAPYVLLFVFVFFQERLELHWETTGKRHGFFLFLLILPIVALIFITDLPLVGYVVTGEGDDDMAFGDFTLYPKWDNVTLTDIELTGDAPHLIVDPTDPLHFTYHHYGTTNMTVHYRFLGMERTYHFDITIYPRTIGARTYAWDRIIQTDEFGSRVQGDLMEAPKK